jgi:hypothetical protein
LLLDALQRVRPLFQRAVRSGELAEDLWYEVQAAVRKDDPATARRKSRQWGVQYRFRTGEEPEAGEDAPPDQVPDSTETP